MACGAPGPSYAHHCIARGMARDDMQTISLCWACHQGPNGIHAAKKSWEARHGYDVDMVPRVMYLLYGE